MIKNNQRGAISTALILGLGIILLLIFMVSGAVWAMATGKLDLNGALAEPPPPPVQMLDKPLYKELDKFVVSLANPHTQHYMMLELSLVSHDPRMPEQADQLSPVIRNALLKHFATQTREGVRDGLAALEDLQNTLRDTLASAAEQHGQELAVEQVLITNVVIQ